MNIAFLHYHLKTGGVTTVLKHQTTVLRGRCDTMVLTGELPDQPFPAHTVRVPGLAYETVDPRDYNPDEVAQSICNAVHTRWPAGCDVLHVHNPTLAKNRHMLDVLKALQARGVRLFLQCHDFAEDGRPQACFHESYPEDCHYGVINSRDYHALTDSGLKSGGLHLLSNPVPFPATEIRSEPSRNTVLYPVRAIRRKNTGEAILLSLFFKNRETLAVTQPPNSPADFGSYRDWKEFVRTHRLNVEFEAGVNRNFPKLVSSARYLLTTSIMEGFGYCFLEAWTADKCLWGRLLPDICRDFQQNGIGLDHLYSALKIPLEWIDVRAFFSKWNACFKQNAAGFQVHFSDGAIQGAFERITSDGFIDFGLLHETFQKDVIETLLTSPEKHRRFTTLNPVVEHPGSGPDCGDLIAANKAVVQTVYTPDVYRDRLLNVYDQVIRTDVHHRIDRRRLLACFFKPETFSLLKWCPYAAF